MALAIQFPGGMRVATQIEDFRITTDQPVTQGGTGTAPSPFDLFLASLGTCAGYYVLAFCRERQLPTKGLALSMDGDWDPRRHLMDTLRITIALPPDFPAKYRGAVKRAAAQCTVKRHMETPPRFEITAIEKTIKPQD